MTKRLVFIAFVAFFTFNVSSLEAKVCRIGDADCEAGNLVGSSGSSCDQTVYKRCEHPRIGATYCYVSNPSDGGEPGAFYKEEDCCHGSWGDGIVGMYQDCGDPIDEDGEVTEAKHMEGWGRSCRSAANNKIYYEGCRCEYGYSRETDGDGNEDINIGNDIKDGNWDSLGDVKFADRCVRVNDNGEKTLEEDKSNISWYWIKPKNQEDPQKCEM